MVLLLVVTESIVQRREFLCQLNTLETGFEFLSELVAQGYILLEAYLIEQGKFTSLPIEAFDGSPFQEPIEQLENQWTALLETVKTETIGISLRTNSIEAQKLAFYEKLVVALEGRITQVYQFLTRQQSLIGYHGENAFSDRYQILLNDYQRQLNKAWQIRQQLLDCVY